MLADVVTTIVAVVFAAVVQDPTAQQPTPAPPIAQELGYRLRTLDGEIIEGTLVKLTTESVTLATEDGEATTVATAIESMGPKTTAAAPESALIRVRLADDSELAVSDFLIADGQATVSCGEWLTATIPARSLAWVRWKALQADSALAKQWAEMLKTPSQADTLVLRRGEGDEARLDTLEGIVHSVGAETIDFEFDGNRTQAKREKVDAIRFPQAAAPKFASEACRLTDVAGGVWRVAELELADKRVALKTRSGVEVRLELDHIRQIDFGAANILYLSDLEWTEGRFTPYIPSRLKEVWFAPRKDLGFQGKLKLGGKEYSKGLALHSRTELTYRLQDTYRRFRATVGIDDNARKGAVRAHVVLTVSGDGKKLFEAEISGDDPPRELDLDIEGVRRLSLLVDYGRDIDIADHLDLARARLVK